MLSELHLRENLLSFFCHLLLDLDTCVMAVHVFQRFNSRSVTAIPACGCRHLMTSGTMPSYMYMMYKLWGWATLSVKVSGGASDQTTLSP
jgi:hypothetical protein